VLLVEDDALVSMGTREMLKALGHRVIEARSGGEALEILRAGAAVDLVVSDEAMPGMRGTELAAAIRTAWPDLPIILATGYPGLPNDSERGLLLRKPYAQEDLAAAIARLLGDRAHR
jgi:CheY-like chemotaxis protein